MPTPFYHVLETVTLTSSASSVTFSSIDQSYADLVYSFSTKAVESNGVMKMTVNNDTSTNVYDRVAMRGDGSSTGSISGGNTLLYFPFSDYGVSTTTFNSVKLEIMNYTSTSQHKSMLMRFDSAEFTTQATAVRYASTSAITSIELYPHGFSNFAIGSTFTLYATTKAV